MLLLRLLQKLVKTLNSDGTPGQVAMGIAAGSILGLTPLLNLHNLIAIAAIALLNISFPAAMLGWVLFEPVGFLLDPVFHRIGAALLTDTPPLMATWTEMYNTPVVPFSNYNNTVVLGSLIGWAVLSVPIFLLARLGVARYRERILTRLKKTKLFQAVKASKLYDIYRLFQPQ
jgi:uncharacterized protein (TIGR03546 family)